MRWRWRRKSRCCKRIKAGGWREVACLFLLAGGRGELPLRSAGDAGMVPLSLRMAAKGGGQGTQLAALRQVSAAIQRILLRAKRKPAPGIRRSVPGVSPPLCIGMGGLFLPWKGKKARMFGMWGDEEV